VNASHLIEANIKAHTSQGYTAWHMVAGAHEATVRDLAAELNTLKGIGHTPQAGCFFSEKFLGEATVLIEFEAEPASGDGWNEPRREAEVHVLQVLVNGAWIDADLIDPSTVERWETEMLEAADEAREQAKIEAAEARAEARRDLEVFA